MDPTFGLADKFRDLVLDQIWEQFLYLVCYGQNIEQLTEQLVKLTLRREAIQHRVDEARNNVKQIEGEVLRWLDEVDTIFKQVEELHKESQAKRGCSITSCSNPWLRYKLSKSAKEMVQKVSNIHGKGKFDRVSYDVPPRPQLELTDGESNGGIDSRVLIMNQIMEALQSQSINMIGLCGPGGVGKTTITKEVAKNQNKFEKVIMATVSDELNIEKIQGQIAEKLGMQIHEKTEDVRACRLRDRLKQEKSMLLILDDLWEELDLRKVGIPFVEGCKILLTSRNETLLSKRMNCQKIISVGFLSDKEALELFKRIAKFSVDSSNSDLISTATEIVQRCRGMPLAIATAAKALKEKDLDEWKDYLARLKNHLRRNCTGIKQVDASLKLSYDPLSRENKNIFLLAAMLSHDPSIEDLLMYSVGLDFLQHIENMEEAHVGISTLVSKLKSLNLFLDGSSSHHVTIHDVFRDVALSIAHDELHAFIVRHKSLREWPDEIRLESYKGICLQQSDISDFPEELYGPRLEFFLLNSTKRDFFIPSMFFKSSKELKVLAFTNMHFPLLPSLSFLKKLKALCLHSCVLEDITEVGCLGKLKVLSLANSEIERLPIEVAKLTSLQMLNLSHCSKLKVIPQKLLSSLKKLEVLYIGSSFVQWKVEGSSEADENASLDELMDLPISSLDIHIPNVSMLPNNLFLKMNLRRYRIFIGERWKWQGNYETSKILRLELESSIHLNHLKRGIGKLLEGVEDLHLYGSNGLENVLYCHGVRGFSCLRHLEIENNDDIKYIVLNSAHPEDAFPILETLKLKNLNTLERLCEGPDAVEFCQLHTLKMEYLPALTRDLSIKDRGTENASNQIFKSLFNDKVLLPKLEILILSNLNRLISLIWDDQLSPNLFSNLKTLTVRSCGFEKLMPLHVLKSLNNLEELEVRECDMLEMVFDYEDLNDYKEMVSSSVVVPLKRLMLSNLPKLKNVWSNHRQGNVSFPSLRSVRVLSCESLTSIFPASIAKGMLCDLEELQIWRCGIDVIVARDQVSEPGAVAFKFPRLTSLWLSSLPQLRNFYPLRHTLEWPHLQKLSIEYCDELDIFEKEVSSSSEIVEEEIGTLNSKYPLLSHHDQALGNLEELSLQGKEAEMIGSGKFPMDHFLKVKLLDLSLKATTISYISLLKSFPCLEELRLWGDFKEAFAGDDVFALTATFTKLTLGGIFRSISLTPSLVSLPNLTHLNVTCCDGLTTLMTSSTARRLVHITHLSIHNCEQIEEIITKQGEDDDEQEIIFCKLEFLKLDGLPRLKRFCCHNYTFKFPLLDQLIINRCPKFKIFSPGVIDTPSLKSVQLRQGWDKHNEIWDTDLNKTIYHQRFVASRELVLYEDDAIVIRNDQFQADGCPQVEILRIERFVEEWVTFLCTSLERFPKLNALHVEQCFFKEIFPSHALSSTSFHNLTILKVSQCHQLIYLVTNSTAKSLVHLETLEIDNCTKMEEIVRSETNEDVEGGITFKGLRILKLTRLPRLKIKDNKKDFNIEDRATNSGCTNILSHNKALPSKLERLELSNLLNKLISLIWDDQLSHNSFSNLKTLIVESCDFMKSMPFHVLKSLNNLEKLKVIRCNKLEMVFGFEDVNDYHEEIESSSVVVPLNLTHLKVKWCYGLTSLMTSSAAASLVHITHLSIKGCNRIQEIITKQEGADDEDKEIFFSKMNFLKLCNLPRLKRFCGYNYTFRFPSLDQLIIRKCPKFKRFSPGLVDTPSLRSVQLSHVWGKHREIWDTSLNKTCYQQRFVASREVVLDEDDAIMIRNDQFPADCFPQVEILGIEGFVEEWITFPYTLLERFPKLNALHVDNCSFEEILLSHAPSSTSFHNLTVLKVFKCHHLVYLVTCSTVKSLVNLETLEIDDCETMEEIVWKETNEDVEEGIAFNVLRVLQLTRLPRFKIKDDEKDFNIKDRATNTIPTNISRSLFSHNKVLLPKLETLKLSNLLNNLISMTRDDQLSPISFNNLKTLIVENCDFMKLVPLHVLKSLNNLEKLVVSNCYKLEMVFGYEDLNDYHKEMEPSSVVVPLNLTHLEVKGCARLTTLMTSAAAPTLVHVTHLSISYCNQIVEIIRKHEGEDDEDKEIFFNEMKFLELVGLPRLKRFCGYNYTFRFSLLEHVTIAECPQLKVFCPGAIYAPRLQSIQVSEYEPRAIWMTNLNNTIQLLFTFEEVISTTWSMALNVKNIKRVKDVFPKVKTLYVESFLDEGVIFPYSALERFPELERLYVEHCSFEEIFLLQDDSQLPPLKGLYIAYLDKLKSIWKDDSQLPPIHQNLTVLEVKSCCNLVKLAPSFAAFENLWNLSISGCHQLIHLVTISTAKSMMSLEILKIKDCNKVEEIVMNETNEDVQGGITFNRLRVIKFNDMPSLKMFFSQSHTFEFSKLKEMEISGCPEMKMFCRGVLKTPKLSKVKIEEHDIEWKDKGDLNKTMEGLFSAKDSINI